MKKKYKKSKNSNINQTSFFFEDYLETSKNKKYPQKNNVSQDRIYLLFFLFFSLILIFFLRIVHISLNKLELFNQQNKSQNYTLLRRDIVDRNGTLLSRNIKFFHAAINPKLIKNKDNFIIKLRLNFPDLQLKK